ncbi:putative rhizopine catabolism regulatory protein MocR [Pseudomonas reidholzensis]|uniref:Putative rhizopine catabolism regulatory protein MocR n=1 Tax=Pseudomonas reidholzensis TaxID=1785162 RepID=A0A383RVY8_9PSED|nr:PLP-dependent aminotransferase family protein [Pseudomonas reidholzensis]SYX90814.1 putative rhizopine catabolism regulatory protein MocR [Pseudomonas reidholzensis]
MRSLLHDLLVSQLQRSAEMTLQRQLYRIIQASVLEGHLPVDYKMPSTRALADQLQISRITVSLAYERLTDEGYLYARPGSGTYVADTLPQAYAQPTTVQAPEAVEALLSQRGMAITARVTGLAKAGGAFVPGVADADLFPFHIWKRLQNRYFKKSQGELTGYVEHGGYRPLREALASYLYASRAVKCSPEQVIITMGTHQSLDLIAKLLSDPGDTVRVESPCHWGAPVVLSAAGLNVLPMGVDAEGACLPVIEKGDNPRLVFVTPSHQYPTGNIMTLQRRREWLAFAEAHNFWILEDDYDSEFRYDIEPIPSLQGLDSRQRVIYMGTFSKVTFPGLRLSYLVVPEPLADAFSKGMTQLYRPGLLPIQAAMADFIQEGHFASHIRKMRAVYGERRSLLQACLREQFGELIAFSSGAAGIHLAVNISPVGAAQKMIEQAANFALTLRGSYHIDPGVHDGLLVLGYGGVKVEEIPAAVRRLRQLYDAVTA